MYTGPWVFLHKPPETSERPEKGLPPVTLIHDNEAARKLGFKGGFVGGLTLLGAAASVIDASFGHAWWQGGTLSVRHRAPVYEGEVRAVWEEVPAQPGEQRRIRFHLEDRAGVESTHGWAALPRRGEKPVPPWERDPAAHTAPATDALPELKPGRMRDPFEAEVKLTDAIKGLDAMQNHNWWYRYASPRRGGPIITPYDLCHALYQGLPQSPSNPLRSSRLRTSMDAGTDLIVFSSVFADQKFIMKARLADKWQTERTVFFVTEYDYEDMAGRRLAVMRAYSAHLIRDLAPAVAQERGGVDA